MERVKGIEPSFQTGTKTGTDSVSASLKMVALVGSFSLDSADRIIQSLFNAAFREVAAAEWFR